MTDVSRENLHACTRRRRKKGFRALEPRLSRPVADEQGKVGVWLLLEQLAYQLHSKEARCAGNEDEVFAVQ
jgi:hypothetical protein